MKGIENKKGDEITRDGKTALHYLAEIGTLRNLLEEVKYQLAKLEHRYAALESFIGKTEAERFEESERMRAVCEAYLGKEIIFNAYCRLWDIKRYNEAEREIFAQVDKEVRRELDLALKEYRKHKE